MKKRKALKLHHFESVKVRVDGSWEKGKVVGHSLYTMDEKHVHLYVIGERSGFMSVTHLDVR